MKWTTRLAAVFVTLAAIPVVAPSNAADAPIGAWEGFLHPTPASEIRLVLRVEKAGDGAIRATVESPDLKKSPTVACDDVAIKDGVVTLAAKAAGFDYRGTLDPAGSEMVGEWKQRGKALPLTFTKVEGVLVPPDVWEGTIEVGAVKLRLVFRVGKLKGGALWATMDSPDQGALGFRADSVEVDKVAMKVVVKSIGGEFDGKLDPAGTSAEGRWKQGGASLPITLKKVAEATEVRRPQTPRPPFPYESVEVAYESRAKGVRISGTLTLPKGAGPFPVALLITGSGAQDRDETLLGHKPFLVLADDLTRRGIAVLRVDDRGVGFSTGDQATATTADFAEDVLGGVDFLRKRKEIDPKRIGLIGHSEGGLIAPMVATRSPEVAFIVLMAGPGLPGDAILKAQQALILRASGVDAAQVRTQAEQMGRIMAIAKDAADPASAREKIRALVAEIAKTLPEKERKALAESDPNGTQAGMLATPWFRYFLKYDPRPTLAKVRCPVLAINGEKDLQVPPKENLGAIDRAVRSGGNDRVTVREMPGLNHLFQPSATGVPSDYGTIEITIDPAALRAIGDWVVDRTRPK